MSADALAAKMAELSARFAARAADERAGLLAAVERGDRLAIETQAHKLAGIAQMFGHPEIGDAAARLEEAAIAGEDVTPAATRLDRLLVALSETPAA